MTLSAYQILAREYWHTVGAVAGKDHRTFFELADPMLPAMRRDGQELFVLSFHDLVVPYG